MTRKVIDWVFSKMYRKEKEIIIGRLNLRETLSYDLEKELWCVSDRIYRTKRYNTFHQLPEHAQTIILKDPVYRYYIKLD